jgi:hypothetical protein
VESLKEITAAITSTETVIVPEDDSSKITVLVYSNRYASTHNRYIEGYPDGLFKSGRNMTRGEIAAVFARLLNLDVTKSQSSFKDLSGHWAAGYIAAVSQKGLMQGYADGTFAPNKAITRAEFATIIARYFSIARSNDIRPMEMHFNDIDSNWAKSTIEETYRYNIVKGYADGSFKPNSSVVRSEAVTIINRMLYRGPLNNPDVTFPDVPKAFWAFGQVEESALSHEYTINPDGTETVVKIIEDTLQ